MTLITTKPQPFLQTHFKYACVNIIFQTVVRMHNYTMPHKVYPGEIFQVSVVAVEQRHETVPSRVVSIIFQSDNPGHLPDSQRLQQVNMCTKLNYIPNPI